MLAGFWCALAVFRRCQVPCSHLVGVSDVGDDERLCDHAQHKHWERA
jgi:hypothetical protein